MKKRAYLCYTITAILAVSLLSSCSLKDINRLKLSKNKVEQVEALLNTAKTRCIGTYLINLPEGFKPNKSGDFSYKNMGVAMVVIFPEHQNLPEFKQRIKLRKQALQNKKTDFVEDNPYLKNTYKVSTNDSDKMQGIIFERMESPGRADMFRTLEGYRWQDEVTLRVTIDAKNASASRYDENRKYLPYFYDNNVPAKLYEMHTLFAQIQPKDDLTIPTEPGFCFLYNFLNGEDRNWKDMSYGYRHEKNEYFFFKFRYNDYLRDYPLLEKSERYFTQGEGHTIYKGTRKSEYLNLEEWVVKGTFFVDENGRGTDEVGYRFVLGINMVDPTYQTPQLLVEMYYKIPEKEAYTEDQLLVIWREITNSIKMREGAFD